MSETTTIQVAKTTRDLLEKQKGHPRDTMDDIILSLIKFRGNGEDTK